MVKRRNAFRLPSIADFAFSKLRGLAKMDAMKLLRGLMMLFLCLCATSVQAASPTPAEARAFSAAAESFRAGFYERAENEFAEFARKFPASPRLPEAYLLQAQARLELTNYPGALELLSTGELQPGIWADEFLFWRAETNLRQGNHAQAAELFGKLVRDHVNSTRRLEAGLGEVTARARAGDWNQVVQALQTTNGVFLAAAQSSPTNGLVLRGWLLLAEAMLMRGDHGSAETALQRVGPAGLNPRIEWQKQYLLGRIRLSQGRLEEVLQSTTNLLILATNASQRRLVADTMALRGSLLEQLNRPNEAIAAYRENLGDGVAVEKQRQALWKITELSLKQNQVAAALNTLEQFVSQHPDAAANDVALLTLAELRIRNHVSGAGPATSAGVTNAPATNNLQLAIASLNTLITNFSGGQLVGKAQLNLGWCHWLAGNMPLSEESFAIAAAALPISFDQAVAMFKTADAQFRQGEHTNAITNYETVVQQYANHPEARTNILETALYQQLRAALESGEMKVATNALARILNWFPNGFHADNAVLLTGQALGRQHAPAAARDLFTRFLSAAPSAPLSGEVELAIARTFEQEARWGEASRQYDTWLTRFTNSPVRPRAEYAAAWATYQAGHEATAFTRFTNFVARFPTNEFTHMAQWWVADYFFRTGDFQRAEINYQLLFQSAPGSELACQAQMMAGRVALARQGWGDASSYFTRLYGNTNCSTELRIQALFAHGDTLMSRDAPATNRLANYEEAIRVFTSICETYPDSPLAPLAWGEKASCYLQWVQYSQDYEPALKAFSEVLASPRASAAARSIAKVGAGTVLEKRAQQLSGAEQTRSLQQALNNYLDVLFNKDLRTGEMPSEFWTRKAGLEAGRLAESLQQWQQAIAIYQHLINLIPAAKPSVEKRMLKAQQSLSRSPG